MARISVNAIKCEQNGKFFFIASIKSDILEEMCFVSRKKEDPKKGFQRLLNAKRARKIATYLDDQKGIIPSALIVSAQDNAKLRFDDKKQIITFEKKPESLLVIDGQHRLYGLLEAKNLYNIPVVIFDSLNSSDEVKLFIDINTTQKGVPTALILDIKNQAGTESKLEERQRRLFERINEDSVLSGYLLANESKSGKISRTVFNNSTKVIFENGPVCEMGDEIIFKTLRNYLEAVDFVFKESDNKNARINKTILFKAIIEMFNEVCEKCLIKNKDLKVESLISYLHPLCELNFDEYTGTNKATEKRIIDDMKGLLRENILIEEDMF